MVLEFESSGGLNDTFLSIFIHGQVKGVEPRIMAQNYVSLGGAPTSIYHFFRPSVRLSIRPSVHLSAMHHISGTVHHLIIIFGTLM